jgi:hypothetical protein
MMEEMWSDSDRLESNRKPRFRADETGISMTVDVIEREGFSILEICLRGPISENSGLEGLSMRRFGDINEETSAIALSRKETFPRNLSEEKEIKS